MKHLLIFLALASAAPAVAQPGGDKTATIRSLVESQNYVFTAQTALPMKGRVRNLTTDYALQVGKASIVCYLPYYGQDYVAPVDPTKGPLDFTANKFSYTSTPGKKQGWDVTIQFQDSRDVQRMDLNISADGYASLQVLFLNREAISFNGIIEASKSK
jgi:polyisoprenoid-binding protein YceI